MFSVHNASDFFEIAEKKARSFSRLESSATSPFPFATVLHNISDLWKTFILLTILFESSLKIFYTIYVSSTSDKAYKNYTYVAR